MIPGDFGKIGAVIVQNEHRTETYLKHIVLNGFPNGPIEFDCGSWVEPKFVNPDTRVFFADKVSHHLFFFFFFSE